VNCQTKPPFFAPIVSYFHLGDEFDNTDISEAISTANTPGRTTIAQNNNIHT
jgi:hypothetical protein